MKSTLLRCESWQGLLYPRRYSNARNGYLIRPLNILRMIS